eukprot:GHVL01019193.1.p1 GENE.GHVL01019193.1~~GHVL01019193.1.p1  ORF type:complete len:294 (-),score=46.81 GHVL01019193.1:969-1850(-)
MMLVKQKLDTIILNQFNFEQRNQASTESPEYKKWSNYSLLAESVLNVVRIGIVGKYQWSNSYYSLMNAIEHAALSEDRRAVIEWINPELLETNDMKEWKLFKSCGAIVVPGGFGDRGISGKIMASRYCRKHSVPFLGICLGMQAAVMDIAEDKANLPHASSEEFKAQSVGDLSKTAIIYMPEVCTKSMGGTMRLGAKKTLLQPGSRVAQLYGSEAVYERHRHRYEVNPALVSRLEAAGLRFSGKDVTGSRMEVVEIEGEPYYIGVQFHPEFNSRINKPGPLFIGLVRAAVGAK